MKLETLSEPCTQVKRIAGDRPSTHSGGEQLARREHPHCCICAPGQGAGLQLHFTPDSITGGVCARVHTVAAWQGYPGAVHGGMVATLVDAAMVHSLFARGITAWTADLQVRFRRPVPCDADITVVAWVSAEKDRLYEVRACIRSEAGLLTSANARFMRKD